LLPLDLPIRRLGSGICLNLSDNPIICAGDEIERQPKSESHCHKDIPDLQQCEGHLLEKREQRLLMRNFNIRGFISEIIF